ncbi:MAG: pyruvate carboxylase subunit B [Oscillospiraceae bacterium]|jgi:oxaloacetate decarboxylase alpha subunit|nr:pyruvate carboxylase subunit B [Oscillospiraceae bacterium]
MRKIAFTETVLRDAGQSLIATRLPYEKFEPILETLDRAGYYSLECWGGATFDTCLRYLHEDPWERLRNIRKRVKNTKLQMLLRGQNLLGYKHYPDDVVRTFVAKSIENGIDVIRIFDALNDLRNLDVSVKETIKRKGVAQVAISYTTSPVHTLENYVALIKQIESMGASTLCIKDMAGVMSPKECYDLVKAIKENSKLPLHVHTHSTTGLAFMTYLKAVEAGADVIDTAISSFSGGTSQPATETLAYALAQLGYETGLKTDVLKEINDYFRPIRDEYIQSGLMDALVMGTETDALNYQIPGGMLSNLVSQLKAQNALDRFQAVLEETPKVREELGYPPLVTPMSQMVGVQAVANVLSGERYRNVSKEVRAYLRGEYGAAPGSVNPEVLKKVLGDEAPITGRFAGTLGEGLEAGRKEAGALAASTEDVLSYIVFPQVAERFFAWREEQKTRRLPYTIVKI